MDKVLECGRLRASEREMEMTLRTEIEIWNKYGAYLIGVTGISAKYQGVSFDTFYNNLNGQNGCWAKEALRNAWNAGQK